MRKECTFCGGDCEVLLKDYDYFIKDCIELRCLGCDNTWLPATEEARIDAILERDRVRRDKAWFDSKKPQSEGG